MNTESKARKLKFFYQKSDYYQVKLAAFLPRQLSFIEDSGKVEIPDEEINVPAGISS
jgi:hypothetical protein